MKKLISLKMMTFIAAIRICQLCQRSRRNRIIFLAASKICLRRAQRIPIVLMVVFQIRSQTRIFQWFNSNKACREWLKIWSNRSKNHALTYQMRKMALLQVIPAKWFRPKINNYLILIHFIIRRRKATDNLTETLSHAMTTLTRNQTSYHFPTTNSKLKTWISSRIPTNLRLTGATLPQHILRFPEA